MFTFGEIICFIGHFLHWTTLAKHCLVPRSRTELETPPSDISMQDICSAGLKDVGGVEQIMTSHKLSLDLLPIISKFFQQCRP